MITLTKIFHFEAAHAIHGYPGACATIHGHSYELHVCVTSDPMGEQFIDGTGMLLDFKDLKAMVQESVIGKLDHKLILSRIFIAENQMEHRDGLHVFEHEPTAENLLVFIRKELMASFPVHIRLVWLRLWETSNSYAEWSAD